MRMRPPVTKLITAVVTATGTRMDNRLPVVHRRIQIHPRVGQYFGLYDILLMTYDKVTFGYIIVGGHNVLICGDLK